MIKKRTESSIAFLALVLVAVPNGTSRLEAVEAPKFTNIGAQECAGCHSAPSPLYQQLGVTSFVRLQEARDWFEHDKHAVSFQLIYFDGCVTCDDQSKVLPKFLMGKSNRLSQQICENLQWKPGDGNFEKQCLTCHAGASSTLDLCSTDIRELQFGVQCESCHGPGSEYAKTENHQQSSWRLRSPEEKQKLGMIDLHSPSATAKVCLSCHLGDVNQNRFVTHAMYAAGHPPLPPFDLQVFIDAMPPHWKPIEEKPFAVRVGEARPTKFEHQDKYFEINFGLKSESDQAEYLKGYRRTKMSMVGSLTTHEMSTQLTHSLAESESRWGDFALYDCMGCHHELKTNQVRPKPVGQIPGRAYPAMWTNFSDVLSQYAPSKEFEESDRKYWSSFDRVPFGDRQVLVSLKNSQLTQLADSLRPTQSQDKRPMTEQDVREWLRRIYEARQGRLHDYWTAKQTSWIFQVAIDEMLSRGAIAEAKVKPVIDELTKELQLDAFDKSQVSVLDSQSQVLKAAKEFDVSKCEKLLKELIAAVNEDKK